jgi:hypothetical protein
MNRGMTGTDHNINLGPYGDDCAGGHCAHKRDIRIAVTAVFPACPILPLRALAVATLREERVEYSVTVPWRSRRVPAVGLRSRIGDGWDDDGTDPLVGGGELCGDEARCLPQRVQRLVHAMPISQVYALSGRQDLPRHDHSGMLCLPRPAECLQRHGRRWRRPIVGLEYGGAWPERERHATLSTGLASSSYRLDHMLPMASNADRSSFRAAKDLKASEIQALQEKSI